MNQKAKAPRPSSSQATAEGQTRPDPIDIVLPELEGVTSVGIGRYTALCPAHDDRRPSLSVREADDGTVLIYCHAGCLFEDIVDCLGLRPSELFPFRRGGRNG